MTLRRTGPERGVATMIGDHPARFTDGTSYDYGPIEYDHEEPVVTELLRDGDGPQDARIRLVGLEDGPRRWVEGKPVTVQR